MIAFLIGLLIPGVLIFGLDYLNNKITEREDVDNNTQVPVLGTIGHNPAETELPVYDSPRSHIAESFRRVRTNLQYVLRGKSQQVIMVTSTVAGEGKTFAALNLASIMAMAGKKVLLVGMDLRKSRLHKNLHVSNEIGLSQYLIGKHEFEEIIFDTFINNLSFVPSGPYPPNPAELLETKKTKKFFTKAEELYDYIVLDTPPMGVVTDALLIGHYAHATIFLIRQKYSNKDVLDLINKLYKDKQYQNINILINDLQMSRALGYKYTYGYGYGYGYGYHYQYDLDYYIDDHLMKKRKWRLFGLKRK